MERGKLDIPNVLAYMLAGRAHITFQNSSTGNRFTYRITDIKVAVPERKRRDDRSVWFVKVLTGSDNNNDYSFIGSIMIDGQGKYFYKHSSKSRAGEDSQSAKVIKYVLAKLQNGGLDPSIEAYHEGRCGRCGRRLTVPESILTGYGPECSGRIRHDKKSAGQLQAEYESEKAEWNSFGRTGRG